MHSNRFAINDHPTEEQIALIKERLDEYNQEQTRGKFDYPNQEFNLAVKDASGIVAGGISVSSLLGVMWLEVLWVADEHRNRGLASWLILEAERIAHARGCVGAGTWTFSWQGPEFYPKVGYVLNGVYEGYPLGMTEHVLSKRLPDLGEARAKARGRTERNEQDGFTLVADPTKEEMRVVGNGFHAFCVANAGAEMHNPGIDVQLALRDSNDERVVGGLVASTTIRIMALEQVWVDARYRGQGYGRELVLEAERIAKDHGCVAVQGSCFSFQAPEFFHRLGYESFGVVDVYLDGHTEDLLIKRL